MNYKIGDKILCKKSNSDNSVIKDNYYFIGDIDDSDVFFIFIVLFPGKNFGRWFEVRENNNYYRSSHLNFYDYFYTEKEIRKLKLQKLST